MKKSAILLLITSIIFFSCKKEAAAPSVENEKPSGKRGYASFNITDFIQKIENLPSARKKPTAGNFKDSALHEKVQHVYFMIYENTTQELVRWVHQSYEQDSAAFGIFADSLDYGDYTLVAAAATDTLTTNNSPILPGLSILGRFTEYNSELLPWPDMFSKLHTFQVGPQPDTTSLELDRIVSKLEVHLPDAALSMYRVAVEVRGDYSLFDLTTNGTPASFPLIPFKMTRVNDTTFSSYVINTNTPFAVQIQVINDEIDHMVVKDIPDVRCYRNKKTIISGKISSFDPAAPGFSDISIKINDAWQDGGPVYGY
jgi:hypothetical protein